MYSMSAEHCIYSEWGPWGACDRTCMELGASNAQASGQYTYAIEENMSHTVK